MADVKSLVIKTEVQGGDKVAATLDKISSSADKAGNSLGQRLKTDLQNATKNIGSFLDKAERVSSSLDSIGTRMSIAITAPVALAARSFIQLSTQIDSATIALTRMLGGADKANKIISDLKAFGAETPFEFPGLVETTKQLIGFKVPADEVIQVLKNLGNAAGGNQERLERLAAAYGKVNARGRASMEELNMFLEAGVPILDELAKGFGVTSAEMFKLVSEGKVGFEDVNAALTRLTTNGGMFSGILEEQSRSLGGLFSTMKDEINVAGVELVKTFEPALRLVVQVITELAKAFQGMSGTSKAIVAGIVLITASIGPMLLAFSQAIKMIQSMRAALALLNGAQIATAATTAGIAAIIIGWVALIILAFADWEKAIDGLPVSMQLAIVEMLDTLVGFTQEFLKKIETFMTAIAIITAPVGGLFGKAAFEALQALVDKSAEKTSAAVKRLKTTTKTAEDTLGVYDDKIKAMQNKTDTLTSKSYDTSGIDAIADAYDNAAAAVGNFADMVRFNAFSALNELNGIASVSSYVIADLMSQLATGIMNEAVQGFKDLGKAMADSKITSEEFMQVMGEMAKRILNMLPMLFLQAGLQLIASGQYAMGLGFVAAGLASSFLSGFVEGKQESSQNAKGNAFDNGHAERFARGGAFTNMVVNKPTRFNQSLMGEAGPEAIMPLTRMQDGSLGVSGGGGSAPVYVNVNNYSDSQVDVQERTNDDGSRSIEIVVKQLVNGALGNGDFDKAMKSRYNLRSVGT